MLAVENQHLHQRVAPLGVVVVRGSVVDPLVLVCVFHVQAGAFLSESLVALTVIVVAPASVMAFGSCLMLSDLKSSATSPLAHTQKTTYANDDCCELAVLVDN